MIRSGPKKKTNIKGLIRVNPMKKGIQLTTACPWSSRIPVHRGLSRSHFGTWIDHMGHGWQKSPAQQIGRKTNIGCAFQSTPDGASSVRRRWIGKWTWVALSDELWACATNIQRKNPTLLCQINSMISLIRSSFSGHDLHRIFSFHSQPQYW